MKPDAKQYVRWRWKYQPLRCCTSFNTWLHWSWSFTNYAGVEDRGTRWFGWTHSNFDDERYERALEQYERMQAV